MKKILFLTLLCLSGISVFATPTKIIIRAKAKDAKFIGTSIGGAYVVIRDKITNRILSEGKTVGRTGNTGLIMNTPRERGRLLTNENTAKYLVELDLKDPIFVKIEVHAPINKKQSTVSASTELWLIPGKHMLGDGIVIEIPGFIVDILKPRTHHFISLRSLKNNELEIKANLVMMCGCTISNGGIWDSNKIEARGILKKNGEAFGVVDLKLTSPNLFEGKVRLEEAGNYELLVYAYNSESGNTGVDKVNYVIGN